MSGMFFAPPKVKSLSRYAEFGSYLNLGDFVNMVLIACVFHAIIIGIYALMPGEKVVHVPVRVLNIKIAPGGGSGPPVVREAPPIPAPAPVAAPIVEPALPPKPEPKPAAEEAERPLPKVQPKVHVRPPAPHPRPVAKIAEPKPESKSAIQPLRISMSEENKAYADSQQASPAMGNLAQEGSFATPKKYVRLTEGGEGTGQGTGQGSGIGAGTTGVVTGETARKEIVRRYEQTISLWIAHHQIYPIAAKRQGIQGDAIVRIRMDRTGHILYSAVDRTSGNGMLDEAALDMVRASNPVPAVPADYPDSASQIEFLIPVSFRLQ